MSAIQENTAPLWLPRETKPYSKTSLSPQGLAAPEYVRVYSSSHDLSGTYNGHISNGTSHRLYASSCDIYQTDSAAGGDKRLVNNNRIPSPQLVAPSRGTGTHLGVPLAECRCSQSQLSSHGGDDVSLGMPTVYPPQPSGSSACLTAEIPLSHIDFWPACRKRALMACDAKFETFEVLVRRANKWLKQFHDYEVVSCETVDKKVIYLKDIYNAAMYFTDEDGPILATHIKGLRLWYRHVSCVNNRPGQELDFIDTIPRYLNPGEKHPRFDTLPQTIDKINTRLAHSPFPGDVLSVETVTLKIAREDWSDHIKVDPCLCQWYDEYNTHQLNFVRLFYLKNDDCRAQQVIGVQDFTPDALDEGGIFHPAKYTPFSALFRLAAAWIQKNPNMRVKNIQTLDTKHRKKSENHGHRFNTDKMFEYRIEERFRAFFLRVGYVMKVAGSVDRGYHPLANPSLTCRMYLPYKKSTGYENITEMLQRVETVIEDTGARVYHVETVPMPEWITKPELCEKGERTFYDGEWYFVADQDGNDRGPYRYTLVYAIRVYYEGLPTDYGAPRKSSTSNNSKSCCVIL